MIKIEQVINGCVIEDTDADLLETKTVVEQQNGLLGDLEYTDSVLWHIIEAMGLDVGNKHSTHRLHITILPTDNEKYVEAIKDEFLWDGCEITLSGEVNEND